MLQNHIDRKDKAEEAFRKAMDEAYAKLVATMEENRATYSKDVADRLDSEAWEGFQSKAGTLRERCLSEVAEAIDAWADEARDAWAEAPSEDALRRIEALRMMKEPGKGDFASAVRAAQGNPAALAVLAESAPLGVLVPAAPSLEECEETAAAIRANREKAVRSYLNVRQEDAMAAKGVDSVLSGTGVFTPGASVYAFDRAHKAMKALGR